MSSLKMFKNEIADQIFFKHYWSANMGKNLFQLSDAIWLKRNCNKRKTNILNKHEIKNGKFYLMILFNFILIN